MRQPSFVRTMWLVYEPRSEQEELAVVARVHVMLGVHVGGTDSSVGIVVVELDDVIWAEVLGRRVAADLVVHNGDEAAAGEVGRWQTVLGVVGVHGISEAASEHRPVTPVDRDRVLGDRLADEGAYLEAGAPAIRGRQSSGVFALAIRVTSGRAARASILADASTRRCLSDSDDP